MKIFVYLSFIAIILSTVNSDFLKIDSFDNSTCRDKLSIYSSEWIKLNYCDRNIIYRFVPPNVGGGISTTTTTSNNSTTTTAVATTTTSDNSTSTTGISNNSTSTTGDNSTSITTNTNLITSSDILTTIISSLTGFGALNVDYLLELTSSHSQNGDNQTTTTTTTTTTSPSSISSSSSSSSSSSIEGTTTGIVNGGIGSVVKYYCLSIGCSSQCVSIQAFPLGVCTSSNGFDNVLYSMVDNTSSIITKSTNITNPDSNNGFCQSFISPKLCSSSLNRVSQYKNDHCSKGLKVNCTGSLYSTFTCLDSDCNQCTQTNSYQLNKCIQLNDTSSGVVFRSVLKIPITDFTLPPLASSNSDYDSLIPRDPSSSSSSSIFTHYISIHNFIYLFIYLFFNHFFFTTYF
ncbi:hypothetical protein ACTA71_008010 [Dictyostelium dimigraforme]